MMRAHGAFSFSFFSSSKDMGARSNALIFPVRNRYTHATGKALYPISSSREMFKVWRKCHRDREHTFGVERHPLGKRVLIGPFLCEMAQLPVHAQRELVKDIACIEELVNEIVSILCIVRVPCTPEDDHLALVWGMAHELQLE